MWIILIISVTGKTEKSAWAFGQSLRCKEKSINSLFENCILSFVFITEYTCDMVVQIRYDPNKNFPSERLAIPIQ